MTIFYEQLREAHLVYCAHEKGLRSLPELSRETGLSGAIIAEWAKALRLPVSYENMERFKLPVSEAGKIATLHKTIN